MNQCLTKPYWRIIMIAYTVPLTNESLFYLASEVKVRGTREMNDGSIVWIIQPSGMIHTTFWAHRIEIPE